MLKTNDRGLGFDYVETPRLQRFLDMIDSLRGTHGRCDSECMMVSGPPGAGKSSLFNYYASRRHGEPAEEGRRIVFARMPTQATRRALAANILDRLGVEPPGQCDETELTRMILTQLKGQNVELLIIEDMQRICTEKNGHKAANLIADLLEDGPTPIVIAGHTQIKTILETNDSIRRRLSEAVELGPLDWSKDPERLEFRKVLKLLTRSWKYPCADIDFDEDYSARMSWAHGGLIGNVVQHMKRIEKEVEIEINTGQANGKPRSAKIFKTDVAVAYMRMRAGGLAFRQFVGNDNPFDEENVLLPRTWALASMYGG